MAGNNTGAQNKAPKTETQPEVQTQQQPEVQEISVSDTLLQEIAELKAENETKDQIIANLTAELQAKEEQLKKDIDPALLGTQVQYKGETYQSADRVTKSVHINGIITQIKDLTEKQCEGLIEKGFLVKA